MRTPVVYKKGYKYQLSKLYLCDTSIYPPENIHTPYISLLTNGTMILQPGYAWDGPSGPTFDTPEAIAASLPHDGGYQLIREGFLDESFRGQFDTLLELIMLQDSARYKPPLRQLAEIRAGYFFDGVDVFGARYLHQCKEEITIESYGGSLGSSL